MKLPTVENWIPNLFLILLFERGNKQGLGLWIVVMSFFLFITAMNSFALINLEAGVALGSTIFVGGNIYDKRNERLKMQLEKEPGAPAA